MEQKHDRKPSGENSNMDVDMLDHDQFPSKNENGGIGMHTRTLETLELEEAWPMVESVLEEYGISCEHNSNFTRISSRSRGTTDAVFVKAKSLLELLRRCVPPHQAIKILNDGMEFDIIEIEAQASKLGLKEECFVRRRDRLVGSNASTLEALNRVSGCYVQINRTTVAVMGLSHGLRLVRRIVEDCIKRNKSPLYYIRMFEVYQVRPQSHISETEMDQLMNNLDSLGI